ncbi:acyl-CoA dehydrogenase family protein [Chondromyces apiculatus]|uniref:Acyl-CoA dehydrogenase family protein n=1 Tax=Chondromyces apiculatus DSM 436 TaxID=1192034 RepID=A0A017T6X3_9BACT|nr:acyl-CoA dehydrogenase [Chondromyces apiculatus]EYF04762.1 Acyl-CoA dehydrogenase family protein [Chondromyces apiculatus DSM 436]
MDFDLSDEQKQLVETVQSFVKKQSPLSRLRALREDPTGWSRDAWRQMGELGWISISLPESVGGLGGSFIDAALILEQLGTTLVPEPMIPTLTAAAAIVRAGTEEQATRLLAPALAGEGSLALAAAEAQSRFDVADVATKAERAGSGYRITGEKVWVLNGHAADTIVVSARTAGGPRDREGISLFAVDRNAPGLEVQPVKTMDSHHAGLLRFKGVEVGEEQRLGAEGGALAALEYAADLGAAAACAEGLGVINTALQMTVEYLKTREQFGVKIGSFQALQHRAVDMFIEAELCRSMMILAALKVADADEEERKTAISAAKVQLAWGGRQVTQQAIQLHGGVGVTDEHDIALYFKRMHVLNALFGDEDTHLTRYARSPLFTANVGA